MSVTEKFEQEMKNILSETISSLRDSAQDIGIPFQEFDCILEGMLYDLIHEMDEE